MLRPSLSLEWKEDPISALLSLHSQVQYKWTIDILSKDMRIWPRSIFFQLNCMKPRDNHLLSRKTQGALRSTSNVVFFLCTLPVCD